MKALYALVVLLVGTLIAIPAPCGTVCNTPTVVATVPTIVTPFAIPLYGAGYSGGAPAASDDETKALLQRTAESVDKLAAQVAALAAANERLMALLTGQPVPTPSALPAPPIAKTATKPLDTFGIFSAKCISCHGAKTQKGDFALTDPDGKRRPFSGPEQRSILKHAGTDMPPPGSPQLTAAELAQVKADFAPSPK